MRRINVKKTIAIVLAGLLLIGAFGAVVSFAKKDTNKIGAIGFDVGALSETDGQYVKDNTAIYTKNAIECQGLRIKPKFDSNVTFQIFWYNEDELYIDCTEKTTLPSAQFVDGVPALAKYCRIVIYPSQLDENGKQIKDFEVTRWEISSIVKNLDITVDKDQNFESENLLDDLKVYSESMGTKAEFLLNGHKILFKNYHFSSSYSTNLSEGAIGPVEGSYIIKIESKDIAIYRYDLTNCKDSTILFYTKDGEFISEVVANGGEINYIECPEANDNLLILISQTQYEAGASFTAYMPR